MEHDTKTILKAMFQENTGRHFLDSGSAYGRHWEINQGRTFEDEPEVSLSHEYSDIEVSYNTFEWLASRLEYNHELTQSFEQFSEESEESYLYDMEEWATSLQASGIYGEGTPVTVNTYNYDNLLDQTLQFTYFELSDCDQFEETAPGAFVLLQVHGGCDVRGGYTAPKVFEVCGGSDGTEIFDFNKGSIGCTECDAYWYTDDAYHWYRDGACGFGAGTQLEEYEVARDTDEQTWEKNRLHVKEGGSILCPECGGKLGASYN